MSKILPHRILHHVLQIWQNIGDNRCQLGNNYMDALSLRDCLNSLGANLNFEIRYIETYGFNEDYLNKVCKAVDESLIYDKDRTESQPDSCFFPNCAYPDACAQYPSQCIEGWLPPNDCFNHCHNDNYEGFYCKGMYNIYQKSYKY